MKLKKILSLLLVLAMVAVLFAGCGGGKKNDSNAFKLGGTGPLTGGAAIYGNAAKNGATIAVEEINAMGGIQFDLRYEDDAHDAEKAVNAYNTLKGLGMQSLSAPLPRSPARRPARETFKDRIFALTPSASSVDTITGQGQHVPDVLQDPDQGPRARSISMTRTWPPRSRHLEERTTFIPRASTRPSSRRPQSRSGDRHDTTFADGNDTDFSVQVADAKSNARGAGHPADVSTPGFHDLQPGQGRRLCADLVRRGRHGRHPYPRGL
jgi:branched-chain amino acid transport system substrate-binding protein